MASFPFALPSMPPGMQGFMPPFPMPPGFPKLSAGISMEAVNKPIAEETVAPPDDCEPNESLYVNNLNSRIKESELRDYLKKVCDLYLMMNNCIVVYQTWQM